MNILPSSNISYEKIQIIGSETNSIWCCGDGWGGREHGGFDETWDLINEEPKDGWAWKETRIRSFQRSLIWRKTSTFDLYSSRCRWDRAILGPGRKYCTNFQRWSTYEHLDVACNYISNFVSFHHWVWDVNHQLQPLAGHETTWIWSINRSNYWRNGVFGYSNRWISVGGRWQGTHSG